MRNIRKMFALFLVMAMVVTMAPLDLRAEELPEEDMIVLEEVTETENDETETLDAVIEEAVEETEFIDEAVEETELVDEISEETEIIVNANVSGTGSNSNPYVITATIGNNQTISLKNQSSGLSKVYFKFLAATQMKITFNHIESGMNKSESYVLQAGQTSAVDVYDCNYNNTITITYSCVAMNFPTSNTSKDKAYDCKTGYTTPDYISGINDQEQWFKVSVSEDNRILMVSCYDADNKPIGGNFHIYDSNMNELVDYSCYRDASSLDYDLYSGNYVGCDGTSDGILSLRAKAGIYYVKREPANIAKPYKISITSRDYIPLTDVTSTSNVTLSEKGDCYYVMINSFEPLNADGYIAKVKSADTRVCTASFTKNSGILSNVDAVEVPDSVKLTPKGYGTTKIYLYDELGNKIETISVTLSTSMTYNIKDVSAKGTRESVKFTFDSYSSYSTAIANIAGVRIYQKIGTAYKKVKDTTTYTGTIKSLKPSTSYSFKFAPIYLNANGDKIIGKKSSAFSVKTASKTATAISSLSRPSITLGGKYPGYVTVKTWDPVMQMYETHSVRDSSKDYYSARTKVSIKLKAVTGVTGYQYQVKGKSAVNLSKNSFTYSIEKHSTQSKSAAKAAIPSSVQIRVRTYNKAKSGAVCYGAWSTYKTVRMK